MGRERRLPQSLHGLSLEATERMVRDRLSWMRFCGLGIADTVADANTLWDFREALIKAGTLDALFAEMDRAINQAGFIPRSGQIVDASLVAAPRQRNTDAEKAAIKAGKTAAQTWPEKPAKAAQKDTDGRWTVEYSKAKVRADGSKPVDIAIPIYGYKSHVSIDRMRCLSKELSPALFSGCPLGGAGHGSAAASFPGERVVGPMAFAPGVRSLRVQPDGADRRPAARLA